MASDFGPWEKRLVASGKVSTRLIVAAGLLIAVLVTASVWYWPSKLGPSASHDASDVIRHPDGQLLVARWEGGVAMSSDGGSSWHVSPTPPLKQLTVDQSGTILGLYTWPGIHEPANAEVVVSDDGGWSFRQVGIGALDSRPVSFVEDTALHVLRVLTEDGKVWVRQDDAWQLVYSAWGGGPFEAGMAVSNQFYLSTRYAVFLGNQRTEHREAKVRDVVAFARIGQSCWAATRDGWLYRARCMTNTWQKICDVPGAAQVHDLVASTGSLYVLGGDREAKGYIAVVKGGDCRRIDAPTGGQLVAGSFDGEKLWVAGDGVFRRLRGEWEKVWP